VVVVVVMAATPPGHHRLSVGRARRAALPPPCNISTISRCVRGLWLGGQPVHALRLALLHLLGSLLQAPCSPCTSGWPGLKGCARHLLEHAVSATVDMD
jgi:hypothetical protein